VCARADTAGWLRGVDGAGGGLGEGAALAYACAPAVARFLVRGDALDAFFELGRTVQRFWLTVAGLGLGGHPYGAFLFLLGDDTLNPSDQIALAALGRAYRDVLPPRAGWTDAFLLLVNRAPPSSARSLRRRVDDVLDPPNGCGE
jgi:hypothetical protein